MKTGSGIETSPLQIGMNGSDSLMCKRSVADIIIKEIKMGQYHCQGVYHIVITL